MIRPANHGAETWTLYRDGRMYLYVIDLVTGETGWLGQDDIIHDLDEMIRRGNF